MERCKKKDLTHELVGPAHTEVVGAPSVKTVEKTVLRFLSPELVSAGADEDISGYDGKPAWDVAVRYQDLKRLISIPSKEKARLKKRAIQGVLDQARKILGPVIKPEKTVTLDYQDYDRHLQRGELDLLATYDESLGQGRDPLVGAIPLELLRFESRVEKEADILLLMDASLSMNGEKIAQLAVAIAVVALCVPPERLALVSFASDAKVIKPFGLNLDISQMIALVLEIPTLGLTNLEVGLKQALQVQLQAQKLRSNAILISDGKYTEGKDPSYLGASFKKLHVLKLGRDIAGRALLRELVNKGHGHLFEARRPHDLPKTMYAAMKQLLR